MIGKIFTSKSFNDCLHYCLNDKRQQKQEPEIMKNRAEVLLFNQCYGNARALTRQFEEVQLLNSRLSKPALHITLSLAPGEHLSKDKLADLCYSCASELGFEKNQFIAVQHHDTKHQHIHIVANRVGFDGRTVSDSNNYKKIAQFCREMEQRHGLQQVLSPRQFLPKERQSVPRRDIRKEQLKKHIQQTLQQSTTLAVFEQKMRDLGYQVIKGRGIAFMDNKKVKIKGSEIGFSLMKIEKILSLKKELSTRQTMEKISRNVLMKNGLAKEKIPLTTAHRLLMQTRQEQVHQHSHTDELKNQINNLIYQLMKPEHGPRSLGPEWLKKKRRKKQQPGL